MDLRKGFIEEVKSIIETSRDQAIRTVDHFRVKMNWELGRKIIEEEQRGNERAEYGKYLIKNLSEKLQSVYGNGFSRRQLEMFRKFYVKYPIAHALRALFTWTHYRILLRIENQTRRTFYET